MSAPTLQVLVGFQTTTGFATPFQLDNATYGLLGTGTLGGFQMVDVTDQVQSVAITRGRNREMEQFNAGTAVVTLYDPLRKFDPLNTASVYYPFIEPRQPIQILAGGVSLYVGVIADWNLDYGYTAAGDVTTVNCSDNFTVLANQSMVAWTPVAQLSGARVSAVLTRPDMVYQGAYAVQAGSSTLGAFDIAAGTNVLTYLQTVTASERGFLFIDAAGTLTFLGRLAAINTVASIAFTDAGAGVPYQSLENQFGDELLYNSVQAQSPAGDVQSVEDATSVAQYQAQQYSKLDLLNSTTSEVLALANSILGQYRNPVLRFTAVTTQLAALSAADQAAVLDADLVDTVSVKKSFASGAPASVTQTTTVSGISHTITPGSHVVKLTLESVDQRAFLTLDSAVLGILDTNLLAF